MARKNQYLTKAEIDFGNTTGLPGHFFVKGGMPEPGDHPPPAPLTDIEKRKVSKHRENFLKYMPEMKQVFKDLHEAGMIDGWRSVRVRVY